MDIFDKFEYFDCWNDDTYIPFEDYDEVDYHSYTTSLPPQIGQKRDIRILKNRYLWYKNQNNNEEIIYWNYCLAGWSGTNQNWIRALSDELLNSGFIQIKILNIIEESTDAMIATVEILNLIRIQDIIETLPIYYDQDQWFDNLYTTMKNESGRSLANWENLPECEKIGNNYYTVLLNSYWSSYRFIFYQSAENILHLLLMQKEIIHDPVINAIGNIVLDNDTSNKLLPLFQSQAMKNQLNQLKVGYYKNYNNGFTLMKFFPIDKSIQFKHSFLFDPTYGYSLKDFLDVPIPTPPSDFKEFWQQRYERALAINPIPNFKPSQYQHNDFEVFDINYLSTDGVLIKGWLVKPRNQMIKRGLIVGHGYGGRDAPDFSWCYDETAVLFPCFRGLSKSCLPNISTNPSQHVLHNITDKNTYIMGGCVDDLWLGVSTLLKLFPDMAGNIGYAGISFGGGIGALALPWDLRINRAHFNVPTFGNQALRLELPTVGSGEAVQRCHAGGCDVMQTLQYYDAASAAQFSTQVVHIAAALFDPAVAPPGQFAIYKAFKPPKELFVLEAGHFDYPNQADQNLKLQERLKEFFTDEVAGIRWQLSI